MKKLGFAVALLVSGASATSACKSPPTGRTSEPASATSMSATQTPALAPATLAAPARNESLEERVLADLTLGRRQETSRIAGKDSEGRGLLARVFTTETLGLVHFDVMAHSPEAWTLVAERGELVRAIPEAHRTLRLEDMGPKKDAGAGTRTSTRDVRDAGGPRARYYEIVGGPLAGAIAWERPSTAGFVLKSIRWIHQHNDHVIGAWLCHDHRIAGKEPKPDADLEKACQDAALEKIPSKKNLDWAPKGAVRHEPQTFADCTQTWTSHVEFDMPWGTWRRRFTCNYDPARGRPVVYLE